MKECTRIMLVRSSAAALLKQRWHDVSGLLQGHEPSPFNVTTLGASDREPLAPPRPLALELAKAVEHRAQPPQKLDHGVDLRRL